MSPRRRRIAALVVAVVAAVAAVDGMGEHPSLSFEKQQMEAISFTLFWTNGSNMAPKITDYSPYLPFAKQACEFLTASPDPYHAVANSVEKLEAAGFVQLSKREAFAGRVRPGGRYYYTLNRTTLVAFAVGAAYRPGNGFTILGGHTDSPNLKVKPHSKRSSPSSPGNVIQLGVECYGGGLWHTWFDRDLGVSGRVIVRGENDKIVQRFVKIDRPVARVSTLAIHLQNQEERQAFKVNKEDHMCPIVSSAGVAQLALEKATKEQLTGTTAGDGESENKEEDEDAWMSNQEPLLVQLLASELSLDDPKDICDFELNLFDTQPASLGGIHSEFLYSGRLDNLATAFTAVEALTVHATDNINDASDVTLIALFDHEEIGSQSAQGAGSPVMSEAVRRITAALTAPDSKEPSGEGVVLNPDLYSSALRKSFVLSVDMAHAIHPNYASKHEKNHAPHLNAGVVIKNNSNQRYATNSVSRFVLREVVRRAKITCPLQEFVVRNDCPCGSTIGPIVSANTGIRTVDAGMPQLSMHSCREVMGVADLTNGFELFKAYFKHFTEVDNDLEG